jgi:hypothetical protein
LTEIPFYDLEIWTWFGVSETFLDPNQKIRLERWTGTDVLLERNRTFSESAKKLSFNYVMMMATLPSTNL